MASDLRPPLRVRPHERGPVEVECPAREERDAVYLGEVLP